MGHDCSYVRWDSRVEKWRCLAANYASLKRYLQTRYDIKDVVAASFEKLSSHLGDWNSIPLRPYQETALRLWQLNECRGIICLPTGAGKTRVGIAAIREKNVPTVVLVPTRVLLYEWIKVISAYYTGEVGCYGDGTHKIEAITVATVAAAYMNPERIGMSFSLLIIDEVHHFGRNLRDELLEMIPAPLRIGLTATFPQIKDQIEKLDSLVGPKIYDIPLGNLVGKYLAPFLYVSKGVSLIPLERELYNICYNIYDTFKKSFDRKYQERTYSDFIALANRLPQGKKALNAYRSLKRTLGFCRQKEQTLESLLRLHYSDKILIFTGDTETAYIISRRFLLPVLTSEIKKQERESLLRFYNQGQIRALVSCRVLNEGLNIPDASVGIIVGSTQGQQEFIQRLGRLLRLNVETGPAYSHDAYTKRAILYHIYVKNTIEERQSRIFQQAVRAHARS